MPLCSHCFFFFFFNDTATTEIYTLSLHDALPICGSAAAQIAYWNANSHRKGVACPRGGSVSRTRKPFTMRVRSEEHTSELQSRSDLVCRLLLEKKKKHHLEQDDIVGGAEAVHLRQ